MAKHLKIAVGADHGGFQLKEKLKQYLACSGYDVQDFGAYTAEPSDYPLFGYEVAKAVAGKRADYGIVICKTGFGMAIMANKLKNIRSAVCDTVSEAGSARSHNACNVLSLAANRVNFRKAKNIVDIFLKTKPDGGRHLRRVKQISKLENKK